METVREVFMINATTEKAGVELDALVEVRVMGFVWDESRYELSGVGCSHDIPWQDVVALLDQIARLEKELEECVQSKSK